MQSQIKVTAYFLNIQFTAVCRCIAVHNPYTAKHDLVSE